MRRLLVNDALSQGGEVTFWNLLQEWFGMEFVGGAYSVLAESADTAIQNEAGSNLIIRNASYFGPLKGSESIATISLLQDIFIDGPTREMQRTVAQTSRKVVFNSEFTRYKYDLSGGRPLLEDAPVIPLPIDFSLFEPGNPMGLQQALSLPDGCVCWIGACQGAAGHVKGWDIFLQVVRLNPDLHFVAVLKDGMPDYVPPNLRCYVKLTQEELVRVIGACRVGLCTSRMESQHLAGIEMGACGLPMVAPPVGIYWKRTAMPGYVLVADPSPADYAKMIRRARGIPWLAEATRRYWEGEFDREIIRKQWEQLIEEIECSGAS